MPKIKTAKDWQFEAGRVFMHGGTSDCKHRVAPIANAMNKENVAYDLIIGSFPNSGMKRHVWIEIWEKGVRFRIEPSLHDAELDKMFVEKTYHMNQGDAEDDKNGRARIKSWLIESL